MEPVKHQNSQTLSQFSNLQSLKIATKFLVSVVLFSVILSYPSSLAFIFNFVQFFSCSIGKNYMFLLCNGILVFICKNSGLFVNSHHDTHLNGEHISKNGGSPQKAPELSEIKAVVAEEKVAVEIKEAQETEDKYLIMVGDGENANLITQDVEGEQGNGIVISDDDDEEAMGLPSAEELNKKCEDFIRKMKEGIMLESQQLIVVH